MSTIFHHYPLGFKHIYLDLFQGGFIRQLSLPDCTPFGNTGQPLQTSRNSKIYRC
jgi:hypothetical protein